MGFYIDEDDISIAQRYDITNDQAENILMAADNYIVRMAKAIKEGKPPSSDDLVVLSRVALIDIEHELRTGYTELGPGREFSDWVAENEVELPSSTTEQLIAELRSRAVYPEVIDSLVLDAVEYKE